MSILKISEVREYAKMAKGMNKDSYGFTKSASKILAEHQEKDSIFKSYDIFLSHAFKDSDLVLGVKTKLEELGMKVYVDWIEDYQLDRSEVTDETASILKDRMKRCKSLFYFTTSNSAHSKWMPWEAGYFDGIKEKVAILPAIEDDETKFNGREYLDLYPYIDFVSNDIWVNSENNYISYSKWISGEEEL